MAADVGYMLSVLLSCFPHGNCDVDLDVYLAPEREVAFAGVIARRVRSKLIAAPRLTGLRRPRPPVERGEPPSRFSALVVSAKKRDRG